VVIKVSRQFNEEIQDIKECILFLQCFTTLNMLITLKSEYDVDFDVASAKEDQCVSGFHDVDPLEI
jgi:hypothetical protein